MNIEDFMRGKVAESKSQWKKFPDLYSGWKTNRGDYYILCPYHREKTPSCVIHAKTPKFFHCYGCGRHWKSSSLKGVMRKPLKNPPQNMIFDIDKGELPF